MAQKNHSANIIRANLESMKNKSILITGCSTGIGRHCAVALKALGWRVFATARTEDDLADLVKEGLEAVHLDYTDPSSIAACADHVLKATDGKLYALFNNGAYGQPGAVEDLSVDTLRAQFDTNFFGWHDLTTRMIPAMRQNGEGRIVQCSSVLGLVAIRFRGAYAASKFALEALSDSLRLELWDTDIHISLIEPGAIKTRFRDNGLIKFKANINIDASPHRAAYNETLERLEGKELSNNFKPGPDVVFKKLLHALESPRPRARYFVTVTTWMAALGRRFLPTKIYDMLLVRQSG